MRSAKHAPLVSRDGNGVTIQEGWLKPKTKAKVRNTVRTSKTKNEDTAEFLWQTKLSKGDYHASMTDAMFMECDLNAAVHQLSTSCSRR